MCSPARRRSRGEDEDRLQREAIDLLGLIVLRNETAIPERSRPSSSTLRRLDRTASGAGRARRADGAGAGGARTLRRVRPRRAPAGARADPRGAGAAEPAGAAGRAVGAKRSCSAARRVPRSRLRTLFAFRCLYQERSFSRPGLGSFCHLGDSIGQLGTAGLAPPGDSHRDTRVGLPAWSSRWRRRADPAAGGAVPEAGDRFRPLGMGGRRKKLQDVLVDRKVAREERDSLPLVVDSADKIVWVVGRGRGRGFSGHGAFTRRDILESKAVRRPRLNSTLKSLLFWMVLVVVAVLIWQFLRELAAEAPSRSRSRRS